MKLNETMLKKEFEELLNDIHETVDICGYKYASGTALRRLDPIAFACGCDAWIDDRLTDGELFYHSDGEIYDEPER